MEPRKVIDGVIANARLRVSGEAVCSPPTLIQPETKDKKKDKLAQRLDSACFGEQWLTPRWQMTVYLQLAGADLAVEILITVADVVVLVPMLSMSFSLLM